MYDKQDESKSHAEVKCDEIVQMDEKVEVFNVEQKESEEQKEELEKSGVMTCQCGRGAGFSRNMFSLVFPLHFLFISIF